MTPVPGDSLTHYKQLMGVFLAKQQAKGRQAIDSVSKRSFYLTNSPAVRI